MEGKELLMGDVLIQIDYGADETEKQFCRFEISAGSVKNNEYIKIKQKPNNEFWKWKRERNIQLITWSITFDLNLKKSNEAHLAAENKLANKLFLKSELSDVKIFCEDKIFDCHKTILCCQSEVFKGMQT